MYWKDILLKEYNRKAFNVKDFINVHYNNIEGSNREAKRLRVKRVLDNLYTFGTVDNPNYRKGKSNKPAVNRDSKTSVSYDNGAYIYDRIIEVAEGTALTPDIIMTAHNIDPKKWEVVTYKNNFWQSQQKGGKVVELYQSKVTVKPIIEKEIDFEDIDRYFENKDWSVKPETAPFFYDDSKESLEIDFCDSHHGLLAWRGETGNDYDIYISTTRFKQVFLDIVNRCKGRKFKVINFVTLGDILHIDNNKNETNRGTRQDVDGRLAKIFDLALDTIIECIDILLELNCPIRYTYTCGNHDTFSGYALAKCVQKAFSKNPNIIFDVSPMPQKIYRYGNSLVGYCHGDMNSKNLGEWLQKKYRKEYGECRFSEVHCGHLHSEAVKENCGVLIKHLPTICESSYWENAEGYHSDKGLMAFIYNDDTGLRETWYSYI